MQHVGFIIFAFRMYTIIYRKITKCIFFIITVTHLRAQIKLTCCPAAVVSAVMTESDEVMTPSLYVSHEQYAASGAPF